MPAYFRWVFISLFLFSFPDVQHVRGQAFPAEIFSQENSSSLKTIEQDFRHFLHTGKEILTAPLEFKGENWRNVGLVSGGTIALFLVDKDLRHLALSHQNSTNDRIFNFDHFYGNGYTAFLTAGIYGFGLLSQHSAVRKAGLRSMETFFYSGLVTTVLKELIGRRRPYGGDNHLFFKPFRLASLYQSLPSGHTTVSFAVSTALAKSLDNSLWKTFWYGSAGMVAASRVYHNAHWFSDVFLGGIIGYSLADFVTKSDQVKSVQQNPHPTVLPYFSRSGLGIYFFLP